MFKELDISVYTEFIKTYLVEKGMIPFWASAINLAVTVLILALTVLFFDIILRKVIVTSFKLFSIKTKTSFDDFLVQSKFPRYIAHIIPLYFLKYSIPFVFDGYPFFLNIFNIAVNVYGVVLIVKIIQSFLRSTQKYLRTKEKYRDKPLESYTQVVMLFFWGIATIFIVYQLTGKDIMSFATLGAASAVILLIFKDTILGFVASIQVSVNDIVRIGDWITYNKFGADGFVTDINLATVLVQNWDNTYTTIPTYSLISDSFQNWRGMQESGGRRIKRSVLIKQSSIKFLTEEKMEDLKKIQSVKPYIEHRQREILKYNEKIAADKSVLINGRNQTNFGVFRKYVNAYLNENSAVNKELALMVRQLEPTSKGIPLEIYCFISDKRWENFEAIMADIFDHVIASVPYFDLEIFEEPTGADLRSLAKAESSKFKAES
ncbi:MAG: mechanosensitive ion channel protein MscS [Bacteroidetes bacterium HGW-Bacteroidetes-3]|jgi:miniconductance mechanosensitive channel|nr:MAG: mechanosensitive ion channel protein MscS [Bacteroidetes bacterium HGW-Bacteroidetes-3]